MDTRAASEPADGLAAQMRDDSAVLVLRALLIAFALAACAWFALGVRSSHDADKVAALIGHATSISPSQARADDNNLDHAEVLNPDQYLELLRAEVALHAGKRAVALAIAKQVVSREPQNPEDWMVLEVISAHIDPALNRAAQLRVTQLVPPVGATG
jgi:uncharacterized protein HemX